MALMTLCASRYRYFLTSKTHTLSLSKEELLGVTTGLVPFFFLGMWRELGLRAGRSVSENGATLAVYFFSEVEFLDGGGKEWLVVDR